MQMGKKRFRPRSHGGRGTGTSGYGGGGGGYYQGSNNNGQGNGRPRRRRRFQDREPFGGEAAPGGAPAGPPPLGEDGLPLPEGQYPAAPAAVEIPLEPGHGLLEMHPNG